MTIPASDSETPHDGERYSKWALMPPPGTPADSFKWGYEIRPVTEGENKGRVELFFYYRMNESPAPNAHMSMFLDVDLCNSMVDDLLGAASEAVQHEG